jgi:hypothetical protein
MALKMGIVLGGRFRLEEPLGEGNVGWVWRAYDMYLDRNVAVKVLKDDNPSAVTLERFRREAALPASVQHPGITSVYDAVIDGKRMFIVTELLIGRDLGEVLKEHPEGLETGQVIDLVIQLADALAAAHREELVHRDLKPSNLFLLENSNYLKICDFGIAGDMSRQALAARLTLKDSWLGTPLYMSPEQWAGKDPSPGMDLYAMGCLLYEMLTGKVPFEANTVDGLKAQHATKPPKPPRDFKTSVPVVLNDLALELLAKDPADRPRGAKHVAARVQGLRDAMDRTVIEADKAAAVRMAVAAAEDRAARRSRELEDRVRTAMAGAEARAGKAEADAAEAARRAASAEARVRAAEAGKEAAARDAIEAAARAARAEAAFRAAAPAAGRLPDEVTAPLACASQGRGHFEVFMHNGFGTVRNLTRLGGAWEAQQGIGLPKGQVSAIAAGYCHRPVRVILAVADGIPYLKQWWQQDDGWNCWADWKDLREGSQVVSASVRDVAVASPAAGQLDVFALDADGRIYHRHASVRGRDCSWSPWERIESPEASVIAAVSHGEHDLALVAATDDGVQVNPWVRRKWFGWQQLSPSTATDIACSSFEQGQFDVFTLGADGTIAHRAYTDAAHWTGWSRVPGPGEKITAITATAPAGQHPGLVALTSDGIAHYAGVRPNDRKPQWDPMPSLTLIANFQSSRPPGAHQITL